MCDVKAVADAADVIVNGYAFTLENEVVRVLDLHASTHAAVFSLEGEMLETSMDDIELAIVHGYLMANMKYMEVEVA